MKKLACAAVAAISLFGAVTPAFAFCESRVLVCEYIISYGWLCYCE